MWCVERFLESEDFFHFYCVNKQTYEECKAHKYFKLDRYDSKDFFESKLKIRDRIITDRQLMVYLDQSNFRTQNRRYPFFDIRSRGLSSRTPDISHLGNIHHLVLKNFPFLRNVSALGNVHHLELINCRNVSDVSALGNVHHLVNN